MSIRANITGDGAWHNIGTGPATVQLISPDANGVEVMVLAATTEPTTADGLVLSAVNAIQHFSLAQTLWAQVVQVGTIAAELAVQPEAT